MPPGRNLFKEQLLLIISILGLISINFFAVREVYVQEKRVFAKEINDALMASLLKWQSETYLENPAYGISIDLDGQGIIKLDKYYQFSVPPDEWSSDIHWMRGKYDICDTTQWTAAKLDSVFFAHIRENYDFSIFRSFVIADSLGNELSQHVAGNQYALLKIQGNPIPLSFINPRFVYTEFSFPFSLIWERSRTRLLTILFSFIILFGCIQMLYRSLQNEKKTAEYREQFVSALVHNLRRPAITVKNVLNAPSFSEEEKINHTRNILSDLIVTIDHLLSLSINESGLQLSRRDCLLKPFVENHVAKVQNTAYKNKEIDIQVRVPEDMKVNIDTFHFGGVLDNLLDNAVKYSGEKVNIEVMAQQEKARWMFSVKDNGIGIPRGEQKRVFRRYHRDVRQMAAGYQKGYGIGLSYVRSVVRAHKGRVQVESDGKTGTEMIMWFSTHLT